MGITATSSRAETHGALKKFEAALVDETVVPRFSAGANQHFHDVVDLSLLPHDLQQRIISKAPFVMGFKDAVYDKIFYHDVAGLCAIGPHPNEVMEEMMLKSKWALKWGGDGTSESTSRMWLKDAESDTIRDKYEALYTRVYGNKPDNGSLANFFLRAATYYFDENQRVDWATHAMEINDKRFSNPGHNPMKLMPLYLTKQVQRLVDKFSSTLAKLHMHAPSQMKNLGPSCLCAFKLELQLAKKDEAQCMNEISLLKGTLTVEEHALIAAKKDLNHYNIDLEMLFTSKHDAQESRDMEFVKFAFDQINAIAKTITDGVEACNNLERQVESTKFNVKIAEDEMLPHLSVILNLKKCTLVDAISEVGMFPVFHNTPFSNCLNVVQWRLYVHIVAESMLKMPLLLSHVATVITPLACGH